MKSPTSFRLSVEALRLIKLLAEKLAIPLTSVLELAIREYATKLNIK